MKSNEYWEQRANERMAVYHRNNDKVIAKINEGYDKAIKSINQDIEKVFYNYMKNHNLTADEAKKILNSTIDKSELDKIRSAINKIESPDIKKQLLAKLNAGVYKAQITRLEALKESAYINCKIIADVELKNSTLGYIDSINEAYYRNIFDIQKGIGIGFDFATIPVGRIQEILKNNWSGKHYSKRIWGNTDVFADKLQQTLISGLMSGQSYRKMAKELEKLLGYGKFAAQRLIRTETTYVTNAAEIESYKECDIEKYVFVATLDMRTSEICREHDGKIYDVSKGETGNNLPPLHTFCRSTTVAYFDDVETLQRRARNPETGKTYIIPGNMNYDQWYKKYVI
jgi:SPP1 gp7 family putative phage head morphogenesis protein